MAKQTHITGGVPEGYQARFLTELSQKTNRPLIFIARDDQHLNAIQTALEFYAPDYPAYFFPAWDCLPYDRISPNSSISAERLQLLSKLVKGVERNALICTSLNGAIQKLPPASVIENSVFTAKNGQRIDVEFLKAFLVKMGYTQSSMVIDHGDYAIRGGIIDIFPPGTDFPFRLDLFGDTLESIRRFDPQNQRTLEKLDRIELAPASEVILDQDSIAEFRKNYRLEFGAVGVKDPLYEAVSNGVKLQGVEHWLPFFYERLDTIFDYLPNASVAFDESIENQQALRFETIHEQYLARVENAAQRGKSEHSYKPVPTAQFYLSPEEWETRLAERERYRISALPAAPGPLVTTLGGRKGREFSAERNMENLSLFGAFADHIHKTRKKASVIVASYSEGARERLEGLLQDEGIEDARKIAHWHEIEPDKNGLYLAVWPLSEGFEIGSVAVISEQDVLGERLVNRNKRKKRDQNYLTELGSIKPGDLVVHIEHGVGRFIGLETVTAAGAPHECLTLEYAQEAKLYLPVENLELLSRYGQEQGLLDRLGGGAWQARKAKLKERIREIAERLIRIAAERAVLKGDLIAIPHEYDAFAARFPYEETEDQLNAIEDVLTDLSSGHPMDRLVCGDVGFGKTEVAMRAAFVAAHAGMQVAVIAPTTLLARQHMNNFAERFRGTGLIVKQLSRFVTAKEAGETRKALEDGRVDIIIGTHALLAKTVKFKNLGLLIIDEEQHFGVSHKERLKQLRSNIHVLTMTATPIPRTLQMAMSGVRELSLIATPPVDRLAIRTYVLEFDTVTLREALLREKYRGGQSFFVVPRIADIAEIEEFLRNEVPEVSFITVHGQMAAGELDQRMNDFYDGKYNLLLATTIVESGLDIPTANTLIVHRADMFGLAQLYQIRGRVGRSTIRAYAYLTTKPRKPLTDNAQKRLKVLASLETLGAGFTLASQDLDIRGAGNILGEEQSGHIREVGFELYQDMLEETIAKIKAGEFGVAETDEDWSPQINLGVPVLIPESYIPDLDIRLGLYRRLIGLTTKVDMEAFAAELIDRFGPLPREVEVLLVIMRLKAMCKRAGISRFDGGERGAMLQFHNDKFANPAGLASFLQNQNGLAKIKDNKIIIKREWKRDSDKIKGAFSIARDLAVAAKPS